MRRLALAPDGRMYTGFDGDLALADDGAGSLVWKSLGISSPRPIEIRHRDPQLLRRGSSGIWFLASQRLFFLPLAGGPIQTRAAWGSTICRAGWSRLLGAGFSRRAARAHWPRSSGAVAESRRPGHGKVVARGDTGQRRWVALDGLYSYRDGVFHAWAETRWPLLATSNVFSLIRLHDGRYAIGSAERGPLILDAEGRLVERYDKGDGVPANATRGLMEDRFGGLWVAQNKTVTRIDLARGITQYDESRGLPFANTLVRWREQIYVAALFGLYRLNAAPGPGGGNFERMLPDLHHVQYLAVIDDSTMLVGDNAVYAVSADADGTLKSRVALDPRDWRSRRRVSCQDVLGRPRGRYPPRPTPRPTPRPIWPRGFLRRRSRTRRADQLHRRGGRRHPVGRPRSGGSSG
jgi:hypothetical protein